jgi:two-component system nitrogen regulation response regulator GlnG
MTAKPKILVIDDDAEVRYSLNRVLASRNYTVICAEGGEEGIQLAREASPDVIFLDNRMQGMTGIETLRHLKSVDSRFMVILMTGYGTTQTAIEAMKFGAFDYIVKPFDVKKVLGLTERAFSKVRELTEVDVEYRPLINSADYNEGIVGKSEAMREVFKSIGQVAATDVTVMITGESGTGKELVARCIQQHSLRGGSKPFVAINCAAIPENLIESELFGHEKGAFTGALERRRGTFELCDGGTLFLDEIGDMTLPTQTKILRVLQDGELQRVGGSGTMKVDVRLIAATNKDLEALVAAGGFREDLYYRLNVVRIKLPPLRERREDIPEIVDFILQRLFRAKATRVKQVSAQGLAALQRHSWPGNIRELENVIQRSAVVAQGEAILFRDLPQEIRDEATANSSGGGELAVDQGEPVDEVAIGTGISEVESAAQVVEAVSAVSFAEACDLLYASVRSETDVELLQRLEVEMIRRTIHETGGNQAKAARILGITRATLRKRIDTYSIKF